MVSGNAPQAGLRTVANERMGHRVVQKAVQTGIGGALGPWHVYFYKVGIQSKQHFLRFTDQLRIWIIILVIIFGFGVLVGLGYCVSRHYLKVIYILDVFINPDRE